MHPTRRALLALTLAAVPFAACGGEDDGSASAAAAAGTAVPTAVPTAAPAATPVEGGAPERRPLRRGTKVKVIGSQYGRILGDGPGQAVYIFDKEKGSRSECYGACAKAWPPVLAKGRPVGGKGVDATLLGTTRRRGGARQLTFRGQPLYYYVADAPGRVLCHDVDEFGGLWLVIRPDGSRVA